MPNPESRIPNPIAPIGVFDSGSGGLTVYKALRALLPHEDFVYLGDTARLPYGTKSPETVGQYALQAARLLMNENIKLLVAACNTASALALSVLRENLPLLPVFGVIEPGAEAAAQASPHGRIAVMCTESTARSGAYEAAIRRNRPDAQVRSLACNLLVSLVEEGWWDGAEAEAVTQRYLNELGKAGKDYDTLVLGCTHFPLLEPLIRRLVGPSMPIIDSARTTAAAVQRYLETTRAGNSSAHAGNSRFLVTDAPDRFSRIAAQFVGGEGFTPGNNVFHADIRAIPASEAVSKRASGS